jgi:hypothetical protein
MLTHDSHQLFKEPREQTEELHWPNWNISIRCVLIRMGWITISDRYYNLDKGGQCRVQIFFIMVNFLPSTACIWPMM